MRVDFYLADDQAFNEPKQLACRLIEKAYLSGHTVFVACKSQQEAEALDELLWTFKPESFVPHNLQGEGPEPPPPVQIGYQGEPRGFNDILVNLTDSIPAYHIRFQRLIEIVPENEASKAQSRDRYRNYRSQNYALSIHDLKCANK